MEAQATTRRVKVDRVDRRKTKAGKTFWVVRPADGEGQDLYVWDQGLAELLGRGGVWDVTINAQGRVLEARPVQGAQAEPDARETRILRMSALRAAADVLHGSAMSAPDVIAYANLLLAWLKGGDDGDGGAEA